MDEQSAPITDDEVFAFVRASIASVWELELLLLLHRDSERRWSAREIERQLRASDLIVHSTLRRLAAAQIVSEGAREDFQYRPASPKLHELVLALDKLYRTNPVSVVKAILGAPDTKLKIFSEAFRFKE